jgi:hypothetical protein
MMNDSVAHHPLTMEIIDADRSASPVSTILSWDDVNSVPASAAGEEEIQSSDRTRIPLCALLELAGTRIADLRKLTIVAPDGYGVVLEGALLKAVTTAWVELEPESVSRHLLFPVAYRITFPDLDRTHTVRYPQRLAAIMGERVPSMSKVLLTFLDAQQCSSIMRTDPERTSFNLAELFSVLNVEPGEFTVVSRDTVSRTFTSDFDLDTFVFVRSDSGTWNMTAENLPRGMRMRDLICVCLGGRIVFLKHLDEAEQEVWGAAFLEPLLRENDGSAIECRIYSHTHTSASALVCIPAEQLTQIYVEIERVWNSIHTPSHFELTIV